LPLPGSLGGPLPFPAPLALPLPFPFPGLPGGEFASGGGGGGGGTGCLGPALARTIVP